MLRTAFVAAVLLLLPCACDQQKEAPPPPPPVEVNVVKPVVQDVPIVLEVIGETRGNTEIEIRARVEGFVETVEFEAGTPVTKGQVLYTLDERPFQASLAQARASAAEAEAQLARARQDVARYAPLIEKDAIPRQVYDTSLAVEKAAAAAVDAANAVVARAEIDLSFTKVLAPEDGLVGKTEVYPGTLVGRGQSTLLTRISRIDPIHARASISEREYLKIKRRSVEQGEHGEKPTFQLVLDDGSVHDQPGTLVFLDRNVDTRTGTILFEAAFANPNQILRPGQFARIRATVDVARGAVLVPQRAVRELQGAHFVYVVGEDGTVAQRMVTAAERTGNLWRIAQGLKADELVVVDGVQKVRPGGKAKAKTVPIDAPQEKTGSHGGGQAGAAEAKAGKDGKDEKGSENGGEKAASGK